ncbi:MAG: glycosyltransferase family 39 protein [Bacteroidales bacterium]|nr:glycosyltransferase family 39 protein [Bacteroidales bacterium]MCF8344005.1 glycosyltransferase family 39 protein [Bacteroidales bacterium]MCF8349727.1 glycosyltransferase family 39 protein [Bacteroidales bacterium]MCF8376672.1 glycosyltransferase family 39 protein [Bacteroidales bacterium]
MNKLITYLEQRPWIIYLAAILLALPALLINLGLFPLTSDEHIRGLVALEMQIRDNYTLPTMFGEFYLKKPPLFNWILLGYTSLLGNFNEFTLRLPTVVSTLLYAATIFYFINKHYGPRIAFANAIVFVTCGRMLFWDTMLALIDITFSWVIFINFMLIYHYFKKGKFWHLFLLSYLLTAIAYMLKGLPSLVFQATTLFIFFLYKRKFLKLISWQHLSGILLLIITVGIYYVFFFSHYPGTFGDVLETLFGETTRRTVLRFGWDRTLLHLLAFPLEQFYHFLPWTILAVCLIRRKMFTTIMNEPFIKYNSIIFLANVIVYWTSPEVHPRYLLMFVPLVFSVFLFFYFKYKDDIRHRIVDITLIVIAVIGTLGTLSLPFLKETREFEFIWLKMVFLFVSLTFLTILLIKMKSWRIIIFGIILLMVRIGFNWSVLEARGKLAHEITSRAGAIQTGQMTKDNKLYIYKGTWVDDFSAFYISRERRKLLKRVYGNFDRDALYLVDERFVDDAGFEVLYRFPIVWEKKPLHLMKFRNDQSESE